MDDLYVDAIIDRYRHPTNQGWIAEALKGTVLKYYKTHNPSCGDVFEIAILFQGDTIIDARWKGEGCAISTVSTDTFCEWSMGKNEQQLKSYSPQLIKELTGIETITQAREKCLFLPLSLSSQE